MQFIVKKFVCVLLLIFTIGLSGCVPSLNYLNKKDKGLYPDTGDFPNTKWVCREIDMCIYMFGYEENYIIGTYSIDNVFHRVVANFQFDRLNFEVYSSTKISVSEKSSSMVHCDRDSCGYIYTTYSFDKSTETIVCSLLNYKPVGTEMIPETLTFDKVGYITESFDTRWYAQEINMYIDSFGDVDGYFNGQILIDGKTLYVHAIEIGNNNYYMLSIENGIINNLTPGTTSPLIYMYFEINDNQIIAKVSDEFFSTPEAIPYWPYGDISITFIPLSS